MLRVLETVTTVNTRNFSSPFFHYIKGAYLESESSKFRASKAFKKKKKPQGHN